MTTIEVQEPRNRLVVFRLTEREYLLVKKACGETRRSMSDLARWLVLSSIGANQQKTAPSDLQILAEQLSTLCADVEALKGVVSQLSTGRTRKVRTAVDYRSKESSHL